MEMSPPDGDPDLFLRCPHQKVGRREVMFLEKGWGGEHRLSFAKMKSSEQWQETGSRGRESPGAAALSRLAGLGQGVGCR